MRGFVAIFALIPVLLLGYWATGEFWGVLLGLLFFGLGYRLFKSGGAKTDHSRELILILMELAGKLARADGYVSAEEISFTESAIKELQESYDFSRAEAIEHFNFGKQPDYPINDRLEVLNLYLDQETTLLCLQLLVRLATVDNNLSSNEISFIRYLGGHLRVSRTALDRYLEQIRAQQTQESSYGDGSRSYSSSEADREEATRFVHADQTLEKAYSTLGVTADSSDDEIQRNYRKLRSLYHPDKLQAKKIPQALIEEAERQIIEVNKAWEEVKKARNL